MNNSTVLAAARPNEQYIYSSNFAGVTLEARRVNDQVRFYEMNNGHEHSLSEEIVKHMFKPNYPIKEQPFRVNENMEFWAVLNRRQKRFQDVVEQHISKRQRTNV